MGNKSNIDNQAFINGNHKSMSMEELKKIVSQLKCACKIIDGNNVGTGFFCNIPFPDDNNYLPVLITCNHVLNPYTKSQTFTKTIVFTIDNEKYQLTLDNSRILYTSQHYDTTIIGIKSNDGLNKDNFLNIDNNIFDKKIENYCKKMSVYILHHEDAKELKYSPGVISSTKDIKLYYTCQTKPGSSGGPIINSDNLKVIGIHKGYHKLKHLNRGRLINKAIEEFYSLNKNKRNYINIQSQNIFNIFNKTQIQNNSNISNKTQIKNNSNETLSNKTQLQNNSNISNKTQIKNNSNENPSNRTQINKESLENKDMKKFIENQTFNLIMNLFSGNQKMPQKKIDKANNSNNSNIHEHSFSCYEGSNKKCDNCLQEINNVPYRKCKTCNIVLCLDCGDKLLNGKKGDNFHNHTLTLTYRNNWICDICETPYGSLKNVSFCCMECNFDVCDKCYFKKKQEKPNPVKVNVKVNDNIKNKNEEVKSLIAKEKINKKNEAVSQFDLYDVSIHDHCLYYKPELCIECKFCGEFIVNIPGYECLCCGIILCLDCADKIYKRKNKNVIHQYNEHCIKLENKQRNYYNYICNICGGHFSNISFHCKICQFNVCYKCYCKNS